LFLFYQDKIRFHKITAILIIVFIDTTPVIPMQPCSISRKRYVIGNWPLYILTALIKQFLFCSFTQNFLCFLAVFCDLGGQLFFGIEFLLVADSVYKIHSEPFAG